MDRDGPWLRLSPGAPEDSLARRAEPLEKYSRDPPRRPEPDPPSARDPEGSGCVDRNSCKKISSTCLETSLSSAWPAPAAPPDLRVTVSSVLAVRVVRERRVVAALEAPLSPLALRLRCLKVLTAT